MSNSEVLVESEAIDVRDILRFPYYLDILNKLVAAAKIFKLLLWEMSEFSMFYKINLIACFLIIGPNQ